MKKEGIQTRNRKLSGKAKKKRSSSAGALDATSAAAMAAGLMLTDAGLVSTSNPSKACNGMMGINGGAESAAMLSYDVKPYHHLSLGSAYHHHNAAAAAAAAAAQSSAYSHHNHNPFASNINIVGALA